MVLLVGFDVKVCRCVGICPVVEHQTGWKRVVNSADTIVSSRRFDVERSVDDGSNV